MSDIYAKGKARYDKVPTDYCQQVFTMKSASALVSRSLDFSTLF